ncbi:MAG TPA: type IV pilus biogenesis/stability protein PilW [Burkholderiaceae bacterium]|nr:type IV pilus biogenesis/stability protein PilW [Burkholderiaceae bacterium]
MAASLVACTTSTTSQQRSAASEQPTTTTQEAGSEDVQRRARVRLELAAGYFSRGKLDVALEETRNALRADPNFAPAYNLLGLVYMNLNERTQAEEAFQRALQLAPNDSESHNNYGWFLCQTGRVSESFAQFNAALRNPLYETPAVAQRNAGICALRANDTAAAVEYLQKAFQSEPSNAATQYNLALALYQRGEFDRARFYIGRLNRQIEPTPETLWLELRVERKLGDRDAAASIGSQLRRRFPESREAQALQRGAFDE